MFGARRSNHTLSGPVNMVQGRLLTALMGAVNNE
jgi:hypothetical protein